MPPPRRRPGAPPAHAAAAPAAAAGETQPVRRPTVFAIIVPALLMMSVDSTIVATALHPLERQRRDVRAYGIHWGNNDVFMDMAGKALLA